MKYAKCLINFKPLAAKIISIILLVTAIVIYSDKNRATLIPVANAQQSVTLGNWGTSVPFNGSGHPYSSFAIGNRYYLLSTNNRRIYFGTPGQDGNIADWQRAYDDHGGIHGFNMIPVDGAPYHFRNGNIIRYNLAADGSFAGETNQIPGNDLNYAFEGRRWVWDTSVYAELAGGRKYVYHLGGYTCTTGGCPVAKGHNGDIYYSGVPIGNKFTPTGKKHPSSRPGNSVFYRPTGSGDYGFIYTTGDSGNKIWKIRINPDGKLDNFEEQSSIPSGNFNEKGDIFIIEDTLFAIRGSKVFSTALDRQTGNILSWSDAPPDLPQQQIVESWTGGYQHGSTWGRMGSYIYVTGDKNVYYAQINGVAIQPTSPQSSPQPTPTVPPQPASKISDSKLSVFVLDNYSAGAGQIYNAGPRVIKFLDPQLSQTKLEAIKKYKEKFPSGIVVVRFFHEQGTLSACETGFKRPECVTEYPDSKNGSGDPGYAKIYYDRIEAPSLKKMGDYVKYVDYTTGPNEFEDLPYPWEVSGEPNTQQRAVNRQTWNAKFWLEFSQLISQNFGGLKTCILSLPPASMGPKELRPMLDRLSEIAKLGGSICYHEYPEISSKGYKPILDYFGSNEVTSQYPELANMKMIIGEGGKKYWQDNSQKIEEYKSYLVNDLDTDLKKYRNILGMTLFQIGNSSTWARSDHEPIAGWMANYLASNQIILPPNPTSTPQLPTSTPAPTCDPNVLPQFTAPQGATVNVGTPYTITWTTPPGTYKYFLRINDMGVNNEESRFSGNCAVDQFPGDVCVDNLTTGSYSYTFTDGHKYALWVQAQGNCGMTESGSASVLGTVFTDKCTVQGYKMAETLDTPSKEIAFMPVTVRSPDNRITYSSSANPYAFSVPGNNDYELTAGLPESSGYSVSSTMCHNKTDCHSLTDLSLVPGATRTFRCPSNGYVDIFWHYAQNISCTAPSSPIISSVKHTDAPNIILDINEVEVVWNPIETAATPYRYKIEFSSDGQKTWSTIASNYQNTSYKTYTSTVYSNACFRITATNSCGAASQPSAVSCLQMPTGQPAISDGQIPTPTLKPTTQQLQCYGTQHCTDGNRTVFEYCGSCDGMAGCSGLGLSCRNPNQTCKTYAGKTFYFDDIYPIDCALLTPTPTDSPLFQMTCASCNARNAYLCTRNSAAGSSRTTTSFFCHDRIAPRSSYSCTKCDIPTPSTLPTSVPPLNITYPSPSQIKVDENKISRERIGNMLERIKVVWEPLAAGNPKLDISLDGVTWINKLSGDQQYPYNYFTTTISNATDNPILVRMSAVTPDGQESAATSYIMDAPPQTAAQTTKIPAAITSSSPVSSTVLAIGGILVAVVVAGFMIGI